MPRERDDAEQARLDRIERHINKLSAPSQHPIRRPIIAEPEESVTMATTPEFTALAARLLGVEGDPVLGIRIADELRLTWNARAAADIENLKRRDPECVDVRRAGRRADQDGRTAGQAVRHSRVEGAVSDQTR